MNTIITKKSKLQGALSRTRHFATAGKSAVAGIATAISLVAITAGPAFAAGGSTAPAGGLGAQVNAMTSEGISAGGNVGQMAMYAAALICFVGGVWALWQSRQPQNRENGRVAMGVAGLVLCGLFATGGVWINKAAISGSGGAATVNDTPTTVQFGTGG